MLPWAAAAFALLLLTVLAATLATDSGQLWPIGVSLGALLYAGKEGGIPLGVSLGGNAFLVGACLALADLALTCLLFPLVLSGMDGVEGRPGFLGRMLRTARRRADRHRRLVDRYGAAGLFLFLLVPFAFNGPLVAAILGRLAGLSPMRSLATACAAIATTSLAWTSLYAYGFHELGIDPRLPALVSILVAATVVGGSLLAASRERAGEPDAPVVAAAPPAP